MKRGTKIICLRRKVLVAVGCAVAAFLMRWVSVSSKVVEAAATERQLPIYCVHKFRRSIYYPLLCDWGRHTILS